MEAITFCLPQSLDISVVNETQQLMLTQLQSKQDINQVNIDAGELSRIDTAGLQLLTALVIDINRKSIDLSWINVNDELLTSASRLGLNHLLKLN
ncbi:lipid asymmetry maintenance protein MlaB [Psychrobium sp. nBUS_13]|uniref:STAS domain-containing protein n=1 Tax=Psychrobium sp. nBUS_13 TaxID=3395319 RepID=UPI003EBA2013